MITAMVVLALGFHVYLHSSSLSETIPLQTSLGPNSLSLVESTHGHILHTAKEDARLATDILSALVSDKPVVPRLPAVQRAVESSLGLNKVQSSLSAGGLSAAGATTATRLIDPEAPLELPRGLTSLETPGKPPFNATSASPLTGGFVSPHPINLQGLGTRKPYFIHFHKGNLQSASPLNGVGAGGL